MESSEKDCCKGDCDPTMLERMNYFTGRHLAARDFADEQAHHRSHRFLHNRMLHGWGVVCGLKVDWHKQPGCKHRFVTVSPGMAIDCCGREIIVDHAACCGDKEPEIPWADSSRDKPLLMLCLAYHDCEIAKVPVLSSEGDCSTTATEPKASRFKECWKLSWRWVARSELKKYSWNPHCTVCPEAPPPGTEGEAESEAQEGELYGQADVPLVGQTPPAEVQDQEHNHKHHPQVHPHDECPHDDCGDPCDEGFRSCVAAKCPPEHCLPIAVLCVDPKKQQIIDIIMKGRLEVPNVPQRLTHIIDINWPHGHRLPSSWFDENPFAVSFDRKLLEAEHNEYYPGPYGVNQATFRVESGEGAGFEDLDFVPFSRPPALTEDLQGAEYWIQPDGHRRFRYLENHVIWITIKCDFLLDCHGVRVDGNNNGVPGGTFESWVYIVSDADFYHPKSHEYEKDEEKDDRPRPYDGGDRDSDDVQRRTRRSSDSEPRRIEASDRRARIGKVICDVGTGHTEVSARRKANDSHEHSNANANEK